MTTTNTYNAAGALLRSTTQQGQRPYYDEAFSYSRGGMITDKFFTQDGDSRHETYGYNQAARLMSSFERAWPGSPMFGVAADQTLYQYDAAGNRTEVFRETRVNNAYLPPQSQYYTHTPGTNQLTRVSDVPMVNGVTDGNPTFDDVLTYDPDGSMISRTIGFRFQVSGVRYSRIETSPCNEAVPLQRSRPSVAKLPPCGEAAPPRRSRPSAAKLPLHGEAVPPRRSRKALAWVYTLVGADGRQLATYNGLQGSMCGRNGMRLWPVEFNTYGPNNTRIITRADGTSEVVISDYLGSARVTLSTTAEPLQSSSYHPYGTERTAFGSGARTSYIGREDDKETDLGFYGVRLYEPEYGRFLSTDVLWGKYLPQQPFQYAGNNPVMALDDNGKEIIPVNLTTKEQKTVSLLINEWRSVNDPYINSIINYAESPNTQVHVYSLSYSDNAMSQTLSRFKDHGSLENLWYSGDRKWGMTVQSEETSLQGNADVVLMKEALDLLPNDIVIALIDELNHVCSLGTDPKAQNQDHVQLFTHLLNLYRDQKLNISVKVVQDLIKRLEEAQLETNEEQQVKPTHSEQPEDK